MDENRNKKRQKDEVAVGGTGHEPGQASTGEVIKKKLKCQISYNEIREDASFEIDLETYMKLKYNLNNQNWLCQKQKILIDQYPGMVIEYERNTDVMIINLDVNKSPGLQSFLVDNTVKALMQTTDHLFVKSLAIGGIDKTQVVEIINEHYIVRDRDLYVECDNDWDYLHYVCPQSLKTFVDVLVQITIKQLSGPKKNIKFDMVYKEIFKGTSMVEKIKSENRPLQMSLHDIDSDEFECMLQGCNEDVMWAENLINTEIVESYGIARFAIKDIKHSDEFEFSELSDLVGETLQNTIDSNIVNHFNRDGTISICGPTQGNVDMCVRNLKQMLKSKTVSFENTDISFTQLEKYVQDVRATLDKQIVITLLRNYQYQVRLVGPKDTIELVETRLFKKIDPKKDKLTKFKVIERENKIQTEENKGFLTREKNTIWIKDHDVFTHICAKEDLPQLAQMHEIRSDKLEVKATKTSEGFCVTEGTHRYEALKEYLNQYSCEDLELTFKDRGKLHEVHHAVERKHKVTLKVVESPESPEIEGASGGSADIIPVAEAVAEKVVARTEWDFPSGHRLLVINDDANNCWQDLMVDINIGEKQSSEARVYITDQGKKKTSVHIMQWDGGEKKENDALLQEFERMLKLAQTYDCIDICIPITPVGMWPNRKYIKRLLYAVNNHLKNPDMLPVKVQLCTTDATLYSTCCVAAKELLPCSVEKYLKQKTTTGQSCEAKECCAVAKAKWPGYIHIETKIRQPTKMGIPHEETVKRKYIEVNVIKGQLDAIKADILVNTTNHDLQLDYGAVSKALLKKAGKGLQQECIRNHRGKIKSGEIVVTNGYMLYCDHVFHSALDTYNGSARSIENLVMDCMKKAGAMKCTSIAFPAIGTGNLSYPKHKVAAAMFEAVQSYEQTYTGSSVEQVDFVIYPGDQEAVKIFTEYQEKYNKHKRASNTTYALNETTPIRLGKINVKARLSTLSNCATEAIVYLWEKKEFHDAKLGEHRLLKEAGKVVQKQFDDHRTLKGSNRYKVFSTAGGNLRFSMIVHAPCDDNFTSVRDAVRDSICLLDEEVMKSVSVWFPVEHPLLKHGDKLPEIIVTAVKEVQQSMLCLYDISIAIEGKHNLPKIWQYFKAYGGRKSVTVKIIGKAEEIKRAKKSLQHYTATGHFDFEDEQPEGIEVCQQSIENQEQLLTQEWDNVKEDGDDMVLQQEPSEQSECTESLPLEEITEFLTTSDNHYSIEPLFANNQGASPKDVETSGSDILASFTTNPIVPGSSDSDILGSITTTTQMIDNASSSDMLGSIKKSKAVNQGTSSSDMLGSIRTTNPIVQDTSDSSDEGEDIQLDSFEIVIRCKKRRGGWYPTKILKAHNQDEALKMRYIFSENQHHKITNKIENVCNSVKLRLDPNVVDIECENVKPSVIEAILTHESVDLRVKEFCIGLEQSKKVDEILTGNSPDFANKTVSLFMESNVCYLVSPAHVFEANLEIFQRTLDFLTSLL